MTNNQTSFSPITKEKVIGWIGTGVMGASMCGHLMQAGYKMNVFNRTKEKASELVKNGAIWQETPALIAENSDIIFTIIGHPKDVREVYLEENGIIANAKKGSILIDMTTTEPSLAKEIYQAASAVGAYFIDAPVSGGDVGAKLARLSIMVGGDEEVFESIIPLFELMGKSIVYQGEAGAGQHTKMCNQITIAGTMIGVCESLIYGAKAGLDLQTVLNSIGGGAAGCWTLDNLAPRIIKGSFDTGFFVEHFIKDMGIALKESEAMGISLPGLALVHQLYLAVKAQGHGRSGTQALFLALEKLSAKSE